MPGSSTPADAADQLLEPSSIAAAMLFPGPSIAVN
jgi:hypothetical protein